MSTYPLAAVRATPTPRGTLGPGGCLSRARRAKHWSCSSAATVGAAFCASAHADAIILASKRRSATATICGGFDFAVRHKVGRGVYALDASLRRPVFAFAAGSRADRIDAHASRAPHLGRRQFDAFLAERFGGGACRQPVRSLDTPRQLSMHCMPFGMCALAARKKNSNSAKADARTLSRVAHVSAADTFLHLASAHAFGTFAKCTIALSRIDHQHVY